LESRWTKESLRSHKGIRGLLACLKQDEAQSLLGAIVALSPTINLIHLCHILLRLEESLHLVLCLKYPNKVEQESKLVLSAIEKIKNNDWFERKFQAEKMSITGSNPLHGTMTDYPVSALFAQSFGMLVAKELKPLLLLLSFMVYQISNKYQCEQSKKDRLLKDASDTLRKIISGESSCDAPFVLAKVSYPRLLILLEELTEPPNTHIKFQGKFNSAWAAIEEREQVSSGNYFYDPSYENNLSVNLKNQPTDNASEAPEVVTGNGMKVQSKSFSLAGLKTNADVDDLYFEVIKITPPAGIDFEQGAKVAAAIYGSRLSLVEKKQLPWRSNTLAEHELIELVPYLKSGLRGSEFVSALLVTLTLITSRTITNILDFELHHSMPRLDHLKNDFIELSSGTWWRRSVEMPAAYQPSAEHKSLLAEHSEWLALPLPTELVLALKLTGVGEPTTLKALCSYNDTHHEETKITAFLSSWWRNNNTLYRPITLAAIRSTLFDKVTRQYDCGYAALLLANTEFGNPTTLYYISANANKLKADYDEVITSLGFETTPLIAADNCVVGSKLAINKTAICEFIKLKKHTLTQLMLQENHSPEQIIELHNQFVLFTVLILVAATGHRSRKEFPFSPQTVDVEHEFSLIMDKENNVDSTIRLIPNCLIIKKQLASYKNHCAELARRLKQFDSDIALQLIKAARAQINDEATFFYIEHGKAIPVGNAHIQQYLLPEISLPVNFLRHYFCSSMRGQSESPFANAMMGHVVSGEHTLAEHSCAALIDTATATHTIDHALREIGIEAIEYSAPKGPVRITIPNIVTSHYQPNYFAIVEQNSRANQIRWVRKKVAPHLKKLRNSNERDAVMQLLSRQCAADTTCGISLKRRCYLLNRFVSKVSKGNPWIAALDEPDRLQITPNILVEMRQAKFIRSEMNDWLLSDKHSENPLDQIAKVWVSLIVSSGMDRAVSIPALATIIQAPCNECDIYWFEFKEKQVGTKGKEIVRIVFIDSLTLLLIKKFKTPSVKIKLSSQIIGPIKDKILKKIRLNNSLDTNAKQALKYISSIGKYLLAAREITTLPLIDAYRNNRIKTTDLAASKLCRWLSLSPNFVNEKESVQEVLLPSSKFMSSHQSDNVQASQKLIMQLHAKLIRIKGGEFTRINTTAAVINTWADFINQPKGSSVEHLVAHSEHLTQIIVLIMMWLIDVSKHPGRGGKVHTALGTVKTYLSNIARPLLGQVLGKSVLSMSEDELSEIYSDALDARRINNRASRAATMRRFHYFVMSCYVCSEVDWYAIEPNINTKDTPANANIISMREYTNALELLKNDPDMSQYQRDINQIILILCYRAGLRSGEATCLKINDIDELHWIVHVRSSDIFHTKTPKSNRRISINLLLSESEKTLIRNHITLIRQYCPDHKNPWLFCDRTMPRCLVPIGQHTLRIAQALRLSSGDNSLRLHHARHSYANYLLLISNNIAYVPSLYTELQNWCRQNNVADFAQYLIKDLTGSESSKHNILHAISLSLGHAGPETTLRSYIHCLAIMSAADNEQRLFNTVKIPPMAHIAEIKRINGYKIIERNDSERFGFVVLRKHVLKDSDQYLTLRSNTPENELTLPPFNSNNVNSITLALNDIERILRALESGKTCSEIAQFFKLDFWFVKNVSATIWELQLETGYVGSNVNQADSDIHFICNHKKLHTTTKYIKRVEFKKLLVKVAKLDDQNKIILTSLWQDNYKARYGLVLGSKDIAVFKKIIKELGYNASEADNDMQVRHKNAIRKGKKIIISPSSRTKTKNTDNRLHHAVFLLTVLILSYNNTMLGGSS